MPLYSDLLLHDVGTGDGIEQAAAEPRTRSARPRCGDCASAARCCTTARPPPSTTRFAATATKPRSSAQGYERLGEAERAALGRFLLSL